MDNIVLLSEIHPLGGKRFNPLRQADQWFNLLTDEDKALLARAGKVNFASCVNLINQRCTERGSFLILREWSHLDFHGVPFIEQPTNSLFSKQILSRHFHVIEASIIRDPFDQWLSARRLKALHGHLSLPAFLEGYLNYAKACHNTPLFKYEDFVQSPEKAIARLCEALAIPYDPQFIEKWISYEKITGDVKHTRETAQIRPLPRRAFEPELLDEFRQNEHYQQAIKILGYESV